MDLEALTIADIVALQSAEEHGHEVVLPRGGSLLDQLGDALQEIERLNEVVAARDETLSWIRKLGWRAPRFGGGDEDELLRRLRGRMKLVDSPGTGATHA
jgi:hypothetical protein